MLTFNVVDLTGDKSININVLSDLKILKFNHEW